MKSVTRSKLTRSGERIMESLAEIDQGLEAEADGAGLVVLPVLVAEHGTGDVEVGPARSLGHELLQEQAGGDGAGEAARGDVVEVGEGRLERLAILVDQGQLPEGLAVVFAGAHQPKDQVAVGA